MVLTLRLRRTLAWWLLGVMLLGALAPTVSRARARSQAAQVVWVEVCTTEGARQVALDNLSDDAPAHPGVPTLDHCGLCVLSSDRLAPPSSPFAWHALPQASPLLTVAVVTWAPTAPQWTVQSRAPPSQA